MAFVDEVVHGPPGPERPPRRPRPRPPRWVVVAAGVAALAVVGVAGVAQLLGAGPLNHEASRTPVPQPSDDTEPLHASQLVGVSDVCPPSTDGRRMVTVSFTVQNFGTTSVTLNDVRPSLPLGGLQTVQVAVRGGSCARAPDGSVDVEPGVGAVGRGLRLAPGGTAAVTFRLASETPCPAPLPVQAFFVVGSPAGVVAGSSPVLPDLGSLTFPGCATG